MDSGEGVSPGSLIFILPYYLDILAQLCRFSLKWIIFSGVVITDCSLTIPSHTKSIAFYKSTESFLGRCDGHGWRHAYGAQRKWVERNLIRLLCCYSCNFVTDPLSCFLIILTVNQLLFLYSPSSPWYSYVFLLSLQTTCRCVWVRVTA